MVSIGEGLLGGGIPIFGLLEVDELVGRESGSVVGMMGHD